MLRIKSIRIAGVLLAAIGLAACEEEATTVIPEQPVSIAATAAGSSGLSALVSALQAADLVTTLEGTGPFTVFAPLNSAFGALDPAVLDGLLQTGNVDLLTRVLTFHVVAGAAAASTDLSDGQSFTTVEGGTLTIGVSAGGGVTVNGANVVSADIEASNGVVHFIDAVLLPEGFNAYETAVLTGTTTTLASAVLAAELDDDLSGTGPFTIFAPDNAAFAALDDYTLSALLDAGNIEILQKVLGFHVIAGQTILAADLTDGATVTTLQGGDLTVDLSDATDPKVNGVSITATDIAVDNGVIHLVDEVILPDFNIVETASITEGFSTLVAAVAAGDLVSTLSDEAGTFTVFAPTNDAFAALGSTVDALLETDNQSILVDVLTYHVLGSEVGSAALTDGLTTATVETGDVTFTADAMSPSGFKINGANITAVDIQTSNGVIHVIDAVLTESMDVVQRAIVTEQTGTLVDAVIAGDLVSTLQGTGPFTVFAPINEAFAALGTSLDALLDPANQAILQDVLTYHVIPSEVFAADLADGAMVATVEGNTVTIDLSDPTMPKVNGANIIATDIVTENGVIHLIDGVLTESMNVVQRAIVTEETATLVDAVVAGDLVSTLEGPGPFTVFAPINAAFEALGTDQLDVLLDPANVALLQKVLTYHVISGEVFAADLADGATVTTVEGSDVTIDLSDPTMPMVNGANIIATDIVTENGVIHLIDGVLTEHLNLVDVAVVNGFSTLVDLVAQQGLDGALSAPDADLTVFAPTNEAFAALSTVPSGQALTDVLTYHVLDSEVASGDLSDGLQVTNTLLAGGVFTVNISGSDVTITDGSGNTVNVIITDVPASNGIIHVIDAVLIPTP